MKILLDTANLDDICYFNTYYPIVGVTTNPVTHVEVVAVKSASRKGFAFPSAELMGSDSNNAPINIAIKKLNNIICVVDALIHCFLILS